jgi:hypothetical protein
LAIARRNLELQGGTITAANRDDGGARFEIRLPRHEGDSRELDGDAAGDGGDGAPQGEVGPRPRADGEGPLRVGP